MTPERGFLTLMETIEPAAADQMFLLIGPQDPPLPVAVVILVDDPPETHLRGENRSGRARIQLDVYAGSASGVDSYGDCEALADGLVGPGDGSGLSGFRGHVGASPGGIFFEQIKRIDKQAIYEPDEMHLVRIRMDFFAYYRRT